MPSPTTLSCDTISMVQCVRYSFLTERLQSVIVMGCQERPPNNSVQSTMIRRWVFCVVVCVWQITHFFEKKQIEAQFFCNVTSADACRA